MEIDKPCHWPSDEFSLKMPNTFDALLSQTESIAAGTNASKLMQLEPNLIHSSSSL